MMRKIILSLFTFVSFVYVNAQKEDTLHVTYLIQNPYSFEELGQHKGIEVDIIKEYVTWLKQKKSINMQLSFKSIAENDLFYSAIKSGNKNTLGLGAITIGNEKTKGFDITNGYLKHTAFCVTNGHASDAKTKTREEILKSIGPSKAVTIENSSLNKYCLDLKKNYISEMEFLYVPNETKIMDEISKNVLYFGYVDAVTFWVYLKNNPRKVLKTQKVLSQSKEELGFITPKGSKQKLLFDEFFIGFKKSPAYKSILEKYLGSFMAQHVSVNQ